MNRFVNVQKKEYVDPFQALPLEAIQSYIQTKQKGFDDSKNKILEAEEALAGITPGMKTKDTLYKDFVDKYKPVLEDSAKLLQSDPNSAKKVAFELSRAKTQLANDPLAKAIKQDYEYTQDFAKKTVGSPVDFVLRNNNPLTYDAMGNPMMPTPDMYGIAKDEDVANKLGKEIKDFITPEIFQLDNGDYFFSYTDPTTNEFKTVTRKTEGEIEQLYEEKIKSYLDGRYGETEDLIYYNAVKEAERRGDSNLINDPNFKREVYDNITKPLLQMAFKKDKTKEVISETSKKLEKPAGSDLNNPDKKPKAEDILKKTLVNVGGSLRTSVYGEEGKKVSTPEDLNTSLSNMNKDIGGMYNKISSMIAEAGIPLDSGSYEGTNITSPYELSSFIRNNFTFGPNDTFTSKNPKYNNLVENLDFKTAAADYLALENEKSKQQVIKNTFEKYAPKLDKDEKIEYDNVLENTRQELDDSFMELNGIAGSKKESDLKKLYDSFKTNSEAWNDSMFGYSKETRDKFINWYEKDRQVNLNKSLEEKFKNSKNPKIKEYYKMWDNLNNYSSTQELITLPKNKETEDFVRTTILEMGDTSIEAVNLATDEVMNDKQLKEIFDSIPINKTTGLKDFSSIDLSIVWDPGDNLVGTLSIPGSDTKIEFKPKNINIEEYAKKLAPDDYNTIMLYSSIGNQLYNEPNKEHFTNLGLYENVPIKLNADYIVQGKPGYEYTHPDGTTQYSSSLANIMIEYNKASQEFLQKNNNDKLAEQLPYYSILQNKEIKGAVKQEAAEKFNEIENKYANKRPIIGEGGTSLGK